MESSGVRVARSKEPELKPAAEPPQWLTGFLDELQSGAARIPESPWLKDGVKIYYYQQAALNAMANGTNANTVLAFRMGLGKTMTVLERFARIIYGDGVHEECTYPEPRPHRKCLLAVPPSLFEVWTNTMDAYFRPGTFSRLVIDPKKRVDMVLARQSLVRTVGSGGSNVFIVSTDWLTATARDAIRHLSCRGVSPSLQYRHGKIADKRYDNVWVAWQKRRFAGEKTYDTEFCDNFNNCADMDVYLSERMKRAYDAVVKDNQKIAYLSDISRRLWKEIITGQVRPNGATDFTEKRASRWAFLGEVVWSCFAMDEAHKMNNANTVINSVASMIVAKTRILATGTPVETDANQMRNLLLALRCHKPNVLDMNLWKNLIKGPLMPTYVRAMIDRHVLFLSKDIIEAAYCLEKADSVHRRAQGLGLPTPTNLLKKANVKIEYLAVRTQAEVDACNYVLKQLLSHVPRWVVETHERIEKRRAKEKERRKRKRDGEQQEADERRENASAPSMGNILQYSGDAREKEELIVMDGDGALLRSEKLTPLEAARTMRNLCFSAATTDPRTLVAKRYLEEIIQFGAKVVFEEEEWKVDESSKRMSCVIKHRLQFPPRKAGQAPSAAPLRISVVNDPLLPRDIVERVRAAGNSTKIERIVQDVKNSPHDWKHVVFVRYYLHIYLLMEALRAALPEDAPVPLVLYGNTRREERSEMIERFKKEKRHRVMIANPDVAGVGLDFSFANSAWVPMPHFNPKRDQQSVDRLNRLGRKQDGPAAHIRYLVLADSLEESILAKRQFREGIALFLLGGTDMHPDAVYDDEVEQYVVGKNGKAARTRQKQTAILDAIKNTKAIEFTEVPGDSLLGAVESSDSEEDDSSNSNGSFYSDDFDFLDNLDGDDERRRSECWPMDDAQSHATPLGTERNSGKKRLTRIDDDMFFLDSILKEQDMDLFGDSDEDLAM